MKSALSNLWADYGNAQNYNTREYIEQVTFPEESKFYIGRIAGQETIGTKKGTDAGKEHIKIEKFENHSGFKKFSEKAD